MSRYTRGARFTYLPPESAARKYVPLLILALGWLFLGASAVLQVASTQARADISMSGSGSAASVGSSPRVLGISPGVGMRPDAIAGQAPVAVSFSEAMDHASTQRAFSLSPAAPGSFSWQQNTLIFTPKQPLMPKTTYMALVNTSARGASGKKLAAPMSTRFETDAPPSVLRTLPSPDAREVPTDSVVTVSFNHPMIPLTSLNNQPDIAKWVAIKPAVPGRWVWLGTASAGFRASAGFAPSTDYVIEIKAGWPDAAGVAMTQGTRFAFTTIRPSIQTIRPGNSSGNVPVDAPVIVRFNMPVEHDGVQRAFILHKVGTGNGSTVPGTFVWSPLSDVFTFTASSLLSFKQGYTIAFNGPVKPVGGGPGELAGGTGANTATFTTADTTRVVAHHPDNGDGEVIPGTRFGFTFNNPLAPGQNVAAFLSVDPRPEGYSNYLVVDDRSVYTDHVKLLPETTYHFQLKAGLKDKWGFPVAPAAWDVVVGKTPPPPAPQPSVQLEGQGGFSIVYADAPSRLRIDAANVPTLTLRLYSLSEATVHSALLEGPSRLLANAGELKRQWEVAVPLSGTATATIYPALSLNGISDRLTPGYYFLHIEKPWALQEHQDAWVVLLVGRTGFVTKYEGTDLLVWAADLGTGAPAPDYPLRIEQIGNIQAQHGRTGPDGVLRVTVPPKTAGPGVLVWSEKEDDAAFVSTEGGYGSGSQRQAMPVQEYRAALYTDRPIYRPAQIVYYRGIYRLDDDAAYTLPPSGMQVQLSVFGGGKEVYTGTATLLPTGNFNGQFSLPADAPTGDYSLYMETPARNGVYYRGSASVQFKVEEYRKPDFQVNVAALPGVIYGDPVTASLQTSYYFGGPLANVTTTVNTVLTPYYFNWSDPDSGEYYMFGENNYSYYDYYNGNGEPPDHGATDRTLEARTGKDGTLTMDVTRAVTTTDGSKSVLIEGQVHDLSNQVVASSATTIVHQGQHYVGLATDYILTAGQPATVTVRTVAPDLTVSGGGRSYPNAPVSLSFFRQEWVAPQDGRGAWTRNDIPVGRADVRTDAKGRATYLFTPPSAGEYLLRAESSDNRGNRIKSSIEFYAWSNDPGYVPWRYGDKGEMSLVADREEYKIGDTARILVTSPFSQSHALLTVERGHIKRYRVLTLQGSAPTVEVPLEAGDLPNVHISLALLGSGSPPEGAPADLGTRAVLRTGTVDLSIDTSSKQLQVNIEPGGGPIEPGTTSTVTVRIREEGGQPVQGEFSLAAVDEAIFALADVNTPDVFGSFWATRESRVGMSASFTNSWNPGCPQCRTETLPAVPGVLPQTGPINGMPTTGGGGVAEAPVRIRSDFRDTAFWRATVATGPDGRALVAIKWPDNLTTWRLAALGVTRDTRIGSASAPLTVTQQLLLRPVQPRFFLEGDSPSPQAIIHNNTPGALQLEASLVVSGAIALDPASSSVQTLTVAPGAQAVVTWRARVGSGDTANMRYWVHTVGKASAAGKTRYMEDAVAVRIPVHPFAAPETVATSGEVSGLRADESVLIPYSISPVLGEMVVQVSPSLAAATTDGVPYLKDYPYECSEQTTSRYLPLVTLEQAYREQGRKTQFSSELPGLLERAFKRLAALQHSDGGWGWWLEDITGWWQTAYVVQGLTAARDAGYQVPGDLLQRGTERLRQFQEGNSTDGIDDSTYHLNMRAYSLYVLSTAKGPDAALSKEGIDLVNQRQRMSVHARAWLALALGKMGMGKEGKQVLDSLVASVKQTSTTAHWDETMPDYWSMSTDTRATALALDALVALEPNDPLVSKTVRWLVSSRQDGHWRTTQESTWSIIALAHYIRQSKELGADYTWQVAAFDKTLGRGVANTASLTQTTTLRMPVSAMPQNTLGDLALTRSAANGEMYYQVSLRYYVPGQGIQARSEGLGITRSYYNATGNDIVKDVRAGDLVRVRLQIVVPQTAYYVMVTDPLPAGLEGVNGSLNTASFTEQPKDPRGVAQDEDSGGYHGYYGYCVRCYRWGPFDNVEMRDDRTVLFASYMSPGTYVYEYYARATTPGTYMALPTHAELMYFPDVFGHSEGGAFTVKQP